MPKLNTIVTGSGEPLVMLHGWGWDSGIWEPLVPDLSQYFQVIRIDLPGFGKNQGYEAGSYEINHLAEALLKVVPQKAIWLGWSLGGMIAWWIALHYPNRIKRLITVASSPKFVAEGDWPGVTPLVLEKFKDNLVRDYHQTLADFLELQLRGSQPSSRVLPPSSRGLTAGPSPTAPLPPLLNSLTLLRTLDLRHDLQKTTCPSLHIFGSNDALVPRAVVPLLQAKLPNSQFEIIKRTGHMPFLTHKEDFLRYLIEQA